VPQFLDNPHGSAAFVTLFNKTQKMNEWSELKKPIDLEDYTHKKTCKVLEYFQVCSQYTGLEV
jgi:hypothetical protein